MVLALSLGVAVLFKDELPILSSVRNMHRCCFTNSEVECRVKHAPLMQSNDSSPLPFFTCFHALTSQSGSLIARISSRCLMMFSCLLAFFSELSFLFH